MHTSFRLRTSAFCGLRPVLTLSFARNVREFIVEVFVSGCYSGSVSVWMDVSGCDSVGSGEYRLDSTTSQSVLMGSTPTLCEGF